MNLWNVDHRGETSPLRTPIYLGVARERSTSSGRLYYTGRWRRVADDGFQPVNLYVVAREINLSGAHSCPRGEP